jgi:hypothetical protein
MTMANPLSNFAHEVLSDITSHLVSLNVSKIKDIFESALADLEDLPADIETARSIFDEMNVIYKELGPAESIAKSLFPELVPLFLILDELSALESKMSAALVPLKPVNK